MHLHEYQSKQYFARFGIPVPPGRTADSQASARAAAAEFGVPIIVNAQVPENPRLFRLASTPDEAEHVARDILAMTIGGLRVRTLLIEPALDVAAEFSLALYADRGTQLHLIASNRVENTARETIDPFLGVRDYQARNLANSLNLPRETWGVFTQIALGLYRCAVECDAVRAEINPLGLTRSGELLALGGRLVIDDSALFRQPAIAAMRDSKAEYENVAAARAAGIPYVHLSGTIGCIVTGAGLGMASMDMLARYGLPAACLIDLGSDAPREKISAALRLAMPDSRAILFNLFADRSGCEEMAHALLDALDEAAPAVPVMVRIAGAGSETAEAMLSAYARPGLLHAPTLREAVERLTDVHLG
jgi:succinyl-CoA synthetase beta subunit